MKASTLSLPKRKRTAAVIGRRVQYIKKEIEELNMRQRAIGEEDKAHYQKNRRSKQKGESKEAENKVEKETRVVEVTGRLRRQTENEENKSRTDGE